MKKVSRQQFLQDTKDYFDTKGINNIIKFWKWGNESYKIDLYNSFLKNNEPSLAMSLTIAYYEKLS